MQAQADVSSNRFKLIDRVLVRVLSADCFISGKIERVLTDRYCLLLQADQVDFNATIFRVVGRPVLELIQLKVGNKFVALAKESGVSPAQLAVLWVKDQPGITAPLIGPRTMEQLEHFLPVMDMQLTDQIREACDALVPPGSAVADFHNSAPWMKMQIV